MKRKIILLLLLLVSTLKAFTQIVNIEDKRFKKDTVGTFGQIDLGLNLVRNTSSILSFNTGLRVDVIREDRTWLALGNYNLIKTGDESLVNAGFAHLRLGQVLSKHVKWEVFGQSQFDERLKMTFRGLLGTGPRFRLLRGKQQLFLGTLYMFEYNQINKGERYFRDHRLSISLSAQISLTPTFTIANTSYYQPILRTFGEARLSSGTSVSLKITDRLSFSAAFNISYDGKIGDVDGVPNTVHRLTNGIRWVF